MEEIKQKKEKKITKLNNKKVIIAIVCAVLVVVVAVAAFFMLGNKSNEKELEVSLIEMGRDFYEDFYYDQVGASADERTSLLNKFSTVGIKVDLDNLERYKNGKFKEEISEFVNKKTNEKCNKTNTKAVIYPKSPYGKTDYKIEAELDCGFEKKEK